MSVTQIIALAWVLTGVGTFVFAALEAAEDAKDLARVFRKAGCLTVLLALALFALFGPVSLAYMLKDRA